MPEDRILYVPSNGAGGYNCAVEVIRSGDGCRIYLRPVPGGEYVDEDNFQLLMGRDWDDKKTFPFWVGSVRIEKSTVPEYEIEFTQYGNRLSYEQTLSFMDKIEGFKRSGDIPR